MARPEIPDSTALVDVVRKPELWPGFRRKVAGGQVWLPSVVLAEAYAGTRSREDAAIIDLIGAVATRTQRLLTPSHADWVQAGLLINRRVRLSGAIRPRDHLADVLIVVSAARIGGTVVTANVRHLEGWARLARAAGLDVMVAAQQQPPHD